METDWKTKWGDLGAGMGKAGGVLETAVGPIFANMVGTMIAGLNDMKVPWMENIKFLAKWGEMLKSINTDLPDDALKLAKEAVEKYTKAGGALAEGGEMGRPVGKGGPGFAFKQISLERTMVGGPAAESLDYQQLVALKSMDKNLALLLAASGGLFGGGPRPVVKE